jgi:hypothetical protein
MYYIAYFLKIKINFKSIDQLETKYISIIIQKKFAEEKKKIS